METKLKILTVSEVMNLLHVSTTTLRRWDIKGVLRKRHLGGKVYYLESDIRKLLLCEEKVQEDT